MSTQAWTAVLDHMQQSLARTLTEVEERERSFNFAAVVAETAHIADTAATEAATATLPPAISAAERAAVEVENQLAGAEKALHDWLDRCAAVRRTLAKDAIPAI
jgi:predicted MarR family transcription regulator